MYYSLYSRFLLRIEEFLPDKFLLEENIYRRRDFLRSYIPSDNTWYNKQN
jgi:hypothetical protein